MVAAEALRGEYEGDLVKTKSKTGPYVLVRHGQGTYTYANSAFKYTGAWENNKKHGEGMLTIKDHSTFVGTFVNDEIEGKGVKTMQNGSTFTGDFRQGELHGQGTSVSSNGDETYMGAWECGIRCGFGVLTTARFIYEGSFVGHLFDGQGSIVWLADGSSYKGEWKTGRRNGRGTFVNGTTGDLYVGSWVNDKREGVGEWKHLASGYQFHGQWLADAPEPTFAQLRVLSLLPPPLTAEEELVLEKGIQNGVRCPYLLFLLFSFSLPLSRSLSIGIARFRLILFLCCPSLSMPIFCSCPLPCCFLFLRALHARPT